MKIQPTLILLLGVPAVSFRPIHTFKQKDLFLRMSAEVEKSFAKYQGLGNDFILIDNTLLKNPCYSPQQAIQICDRNFGIGGDGIIFALKGINSCDYTMRIYNSDGSEPQMCGNGIRCMAKFLQSIEGRSKEEVQYKIWTNAGVIIPIVSAEGSITVDMGQPILNPKEVPTLLGPTINGAAVDAEIIVANKIYKTTAVSMGNPHSVVFVDDLEKMSPPFATVGPLFESNEAFPQRVNAEFVQVLSRNHLKMKVWERGAGPTLACGTGACAVVVAGVLSNRSDRDCIVSLPGGDLQIKWDVKDNKIYMTGPAEEVFKGTLSLKDL